MTSGSPANGNSGKQPKVFELSKKALKLFEVMKCWQYHSTDKYRRRSRKGYSEIIVILFILSAKDMNK